MAIPSFSQMKKAYDVGSKVVDTGGQVAGMAADTYGKFAGPQNQPKSCWLKTYGRGWGHPLSACPAGKEKNALMCYDKCKPGYTGVGPVCWQDCPKDYKYIVGPFCGKPKPYGRGWGNWRQSYCDDKNGGKGKCEKWGLLWYPKCKDGYYAFACCICSAKCPDGMKDIGISCTKKSYGRGLGSFLICPAPYE